MDGVISILSWSPDMGASGSGVSPNFLLIAAMCFVGASVVTRLVKINSSFNYMVNYMVMMAGCLFVHAYAGDLLITGSNQFVASAITANFGMTLAGFVLLFSYRKTI